MDSPFLKGSVLVVEVVRFGTENQKSEIMCTSGFLRSRQVSFFRAIEQVSAKLSRNPLVQGEIQNSYSTRCNSVCEIGSESQVLDTLCTLHVAKNEV